MSCDHRLISYYRDGALPPDERRMVDEHLSECADCAAILRAYVGVARSIRSMPLLSVPPSLEAGLRVRIAGYEAERAKRGWLGGLARAGAPAVAAASLAIAILVVFRPGAVEIPVRAPAITAPPQTAVNPPAMAPAVGVAPNGAVQPPIEPERVAFLPASIRHLYQSNDAVRTKVGQPARGSKTVILREQAFQGGVALWRGDTREIYVLNRAGGGWAAYADSWRPGEPVAVAPTPPPGAIVPEAGFGALLRTHPEIQSRLGWAVYEPRGSGGAVQVFDSGVIVWSPHGLLYVLANDGTWRTYPDATPA